ncbi:MAG: hypothetical protein ACPG4E_06325 [Flavobacteriaceae bacterium]
MAIVAPPRFCKKTFISTAHQKSQVILNEDHLMYRLDEKYIFRKIHYKEINEAIVVRINHLFYLLSAIFLCLQGLAYFIIKIEAPPLYPTLSFILFLLFFIGLLLNGRSLFCVRIHRMGLESDVFMTRKRKEAKALVHAINKTLAQQSNKAIYL